MTNILYVLALTASLVVFTSARGTQGSYCKLNNINCQRNSHVLCRFPYLKPSNTCGKLQSSTLTAGEIQELLDVHNKYRALVASGQEKRGQPGPQPAATNIGPLKWDKELADIAQTWADQCHIGHDACRMVERFSYGQNIGYIYVTDVNKHKLSELVTGWYNEVELFNRRIVKSYVYNLEIAHYSQMMWAETTLLGCGAVRYNNDGVRNLLYLVCNYGPTGNMPGSEIYKIA